MILSVIAVLGLQEGQICMLVRVITPCITIACDGTEAPEFPVPGSSEKGQDTALLLRFLQRQGLVKGSPPSPAAAAASLAAAACWSLALASWEVSRVSSSAGMNSAGVRLCTKVVRLQARRKAGWACTA